jgi:PemK-like, MazF-like toxin of type II toxin-antitoxin system
VAALDASPKPGLVIRYAYLWRDEADDGREEGAKDRPCVVVLAVQTGEDGRHVVTVAPITHSAPRAAGEAVEVPRATKARLGLDGERSWIVVSEVNRFVWPGPDLRPAGPGVWDYGFIPGALLRMVRERMVAHRRVSIVRRGED